MALALPGRLQGAILTDAVRTALLAVQHDLLTLNGGALHVVAGYVPILTITDDTLVVTNGVDPRVKQFPILIQFIIPVTSSVVENNGFAVLRAPFIIIQDSWWDGAKRAR